ncbi:MAG: aconitate hydratase AcnA [Actinobacteria bacterium]|uniref:aconitate hydratase n=1 Tax=freshwater metagenome TaxID=449393 RepID=A0A6J7B181_9ZZZZ|nr:aconitate hydratase AcnA [Actinomycetota bacterium]MSY36447.1 aconitate hydratase AcnA [Actinomycetota bacterium]MTA72744.1 aconitate hydratase AcnA [Actinomycetota bacterium]MTB29174.1 aconitate hydratase AcnA [Actinomycetota bacterium]MUH49273.1 aconitate hydratase AcnA [Actinomycetota bacterium]
MSKNSFNAKKNLEVAGKSYEIFDISAIEGASTLPFSLKVLLENLLRTEDGANITADHIAALAQWDPTVEPDTEIQFTPARVLMQDFTGVPCVVDLATMREAIVELGGDASKVNPLAPAELVIDHSVISDVFGTKDAFQKNTDIEYERNQERYRFLRWGQSAFDEFKVVPPGTGIVHQVNIEYLARVVMTREVSGVMRAYPDTVVGTDSHTTMVNGLAVLGWGVGGIEAEAALLGQPVSMLIPSVVGFKLTGQLPLGTTATDMALTITEILRKVGVVGKFVEFFGPGVVSVPMANRTTIGNMSPEYGSTCAIFPIDEETLRYLRLTGRSDDQVALVEKYAKTQGLWHDPSVAPRFSQVVELDLSTVVPSISGPKRPQDRISLSDSKAAFAQIVPTYFTDKTTKGEVAAGTTRVKNGDVVIASITSCTNTSNPSVMIGAALLAKKAVEKGLTSKPWVKTTLAPGSKVVTDYYDRADLTRYMEALGFHLVGYGCVTCIGNSGPLPIDISKAINESDLAVTAVLSGNRNFEGRISPDVKMNYLASPPLVVAYAIAGTMDHDFVTDSLGNDLDGNAVYLKDIWPTPQEIQSVIDASISSEMFTRDYASVFEGDHRWKSLATPAGKVFEWDATSTYVRKPPYFDNMPKNPAPVTDISGARVLAVLGDSVTTDHISPAGNIKADSPAGKYLADHGIDRKDFNSYGSRRGNHEVMIRGTFANIRLKNMLLDGVEGGFTRNFLNDGAQTTIYEASAAYQNSGVPLVILAGKEYGSGSSRDWAAKGTALLGVRAVIAESFERIHRSNLIGMGVLPLQFKAGESAASLGLDGTEVFSISGITALNTGGVPKELVVTAGDKSFSATVRIDTPGEADYYRHGGIMQYVLRSLLG